jgi:hypothetical protein
MYEGAVEYFRGPRRSKKEILDNLSVEGRR